MPKVNVGVEIAKVKVFDSKFEQQASADAQAAVAKAFSDSATHANGPPKNGGHVLRLTPEVAYSKEDRKLTATCKWEVFVIENGQKKMFPSVKMVSPSAGTLEGLAPDKLRPVDIKEVVAAAVGAAVTSILKRLPK